jgi:hypothetical protein
MAEYADAISGFLKPILARYNMWNIRNVTWAVSLFEQLLCFLYCGCKYPILGFSRGCSYRGFVHGHD